MEFNKFFNKVVSGRKNMGSENENDHDLAGFYSAANKNVAQKAVAGILIKRFHFKTFEKAFYGSYDFLAFFIFDKAFIDLNDIVGSFGIGSADDISFSIFSESGGNFVSVKQG